MIHLHKEAPSLESSSQNVEAEPEAAVLSYPEALVRFTQK